MKHEGINRGHTEKSFWVAVSSALCACITTFFICLETSAAEYLETVGKQNLIIYVLSCFVFLIVFLIVYRLTRRMGDFSTVPLKWIYALIIITAIYCVFWFIHLVIFWGAPEEFASNAGQLPWHNMPFWIVVVIFLICTILAIVIFRYAMKADAEKETSWKARVKQVVFLVVMLCFAVLAFFMVFYYLDTEIGFATDGDPFAGYLMNLHAVTNSIVNVANGIPYGPLNVSIYGHYALFFLPIFKVIPFGIFQIGVLMGVLNMIAFLCFVFAAYRFSHSRFLCVLVAGAYFFCGFAFGPYFQNFPIRMLFLSILLWYASIVLTNPRLSFTRMMCGYLICALNMVFNLETGLFSVAAWSIAMIFVCFQARPLRVRMAFGGIVGNIVMMPITLCAAWLLTNACNILFLQGDFLSFETFLFPFVGCSLTEIIQYDLSFQPSAWWLAFIILLVTAAHAIHRVRVSQEHEQAVRERFPFFFSMLGILLFVYFINRPAIGNMNIAFPEVLLCVLYWLQFLRERYHQAVRMSIEQVLAAAASICLISFLLMTAWQALEFLPSQIVYQLKDREQAIAARDAAFDDIRANIPENTRGLGPWLPELYTQLGWSAYIPSVDYSDLELDANATGMIETILDTDRTPFVSSIHTFVDYGNMTQTLQIFIDERYVEQYSCEYNDIVFIYYVPR